MLQSNFTRQRVFIVGEGSLFDDGVTQLLTDRTNLLVSRAIYSDSLDILNNINSDRPDIMLICESGSLDAGRIIDLVSTNSMVMELSIVIARLGNNVIDLYARPNFVAGKMSSRPRQIVVKTGDDLLNILRRKHNVQ